MRILHVHTEKGFRGGERQVELLVRGLAARGHAVRVACREDGELYERLAGDGLAVGYRKPRLLGVRSPWLASWLRAVAADFRADLAHAHTGNAHTWAVRALLGHMPLVTTRRVDFAIGGNRWSRRKYTAVGQHFIAISGGVRDVLLAGGVPRERIDVVFSGIDPSRVTGGDGSAIRARLLAGGGGPLIGFVGALVDHKAPWVLAEAAGLVRREVPGARVVFVGEGEARPRIEAAAAPHREAVVLEGWRDNVADYYAAFDLFVMPSKLEGLCTALVDALAAGVPAIASDAGGIPDVVVAGETGELVPPEDAVALGRAIVDLWRDPERRARHATAGRERVARLFTAEAMVRGNEAVYTKILARRSAAHRPVQSTAPIPPHP